MAILSLFACSTAPKQKLPPQLQQAQRHNLAGVAADEKDKLLVAEAELIESYRLFSSVENYRGMITALINSSRVYRRQGDLKKADNVLKKAEILIPDYPDLETELYFESCKLALLKGDKDGALLWGEKGAASAKDADRGRMLNLLAAVHLQKGSVSKGREIAERALNSARSSSDRREEANALRTLGDIACLEKRYNDAFQLYDSALVIDKELAIPGRIAADLAALSRAAEALGDISRSAGYLQRSIDATIADQSVKVAAENLDRLINLYQRSGNNDSAERVLKLKNSLQPVKAE
jgi:tetratricopeptide (TPR) repeat protein